MDIQKLYQDKLVTADAAAAVVKSGDWVDYGWTTGTPVKVDAAIAKRLPELHDVHFRGGVLMHAPAIFGIENPAEHMDWNSWHMGGPERKALKAGFAYYAPMRYSELPRYYRDDNAPKPDVTVIQVTPMDKHGYFNFGPNASHIAAACETSKIVIVEVNENMPYCYGGCEAEIHVSKVDMIVEGDNPPIDAMGESGAATDVDKAVAQLIVDEIPNGACLQLGIGGMPNAVGALIAESDLKDLGVHTEMYVDGFVAMAEAGKITGLRKGIDKGRQVYAFGAGTKKLYDYLDHNPACMSTSVDYTNDPFIVAKLDNFISINNAIDCDLFGQVNAESAGVQQISGTGGQLDFVMGAYASRGGKSFICMSSTFQPKNGPLQSRIRATLANGAIATDPRTCAQYIVTEYGKANMKGLSTWQRAEALINIAHPDFRDQLIKDAEKMGIWRRSNRV